MDVTIKEPGPGGMRLIDVPLDMTFSETLGIEENAVPDAYERLIMDVIEEIKRYLCEETRLRRRGNGQTR